VSTGTDCAGLLGVCHSGTSPGRPRARCQGGGGGAAAQLRRVNDAIESGGWWQQFGAVALLRLTPVVPFRYCLASPSPTAQ